MRYFPLTEVDSKKTTILLFNGGGQPPYSKFDKIVRLFSNFEVNLISIELPGHGKSYFNTVVSTEEMLDNFYLNIRKICSKPSKIAAFGYSLGGLLAMKALEKNICDFDFVIITGAAVVIDKEQEDVMKYYTSREFFEEMGWEKLVLDYHKEGWKELLHSVHEMLHVDSEIFVDPEDISKRNSSLYLILGDRDEVADYQLQQPITERYKNILLHVLPDTSHFDYFVKSWKKTERELKKILEKELKD